MNAYTVLNGLVNVHIRPLKHIVFLYGRELLCA
jgi:hypothetical protein